jgi:hypothetical protein
MERAFAPPRHIVDTRPVSKANARGGEPGRGIV